MGIKKSETPAVIPPITYGVWIIGIGWLRDLNGRYFADPRIEYARAALKMWISPGDCARIELIDESMIGLQPIFIERERIRLEKLKSNKSFKSQLRRWIHGLLG